VYRLRTSGAYAPRVPGGLQGGNLLISLFLINGPSLPFRSSPTSSCRTKIITVNNNQEGILSSSSSISSSRTTPLKVRTQRTNISACLKKILFRATAGSGWVLPSATSASVPGLQRPAGLSTAASAPGSLCVRSAPLKCLVQTHVRRIVIQSATPAPEGRWILRTVFSWSLPVLLRGRCVGLWLRP
jgi:hypothetical protein